MFLGRFAIYNKYNLSHHEFLRCVANADEIHALGQVGDINPLDICGNVA